ncbi:MAG: EMC3/TMCO1 family protein [Candidatus Methanofastidiosia archaeon]
MGFFDVLSEIAAILYKILDKGFGFIFNYEPWFTVIVVAVFVGAFMTMINYVMVDHQELKRIRKEMSEFQKKLLKAQREKNKKLERKLQVQKKKVQAMQQKMMGMTMKPMYITMIPIIIFFSWMRFHYSPLDSACSDLGVEACSQGFYMLKDSCECVRDVAVKLPFDFPLFAYFHKNNPDTSGSYLGWLGWYFLFVSVVSSLLRKLLDMS